MKLAKARRIVKYKVQCPNKECHMFDVFDTELVDGKVTCPTCRETLLLTLDEGNYVEYVNKIIKQY